MSFSFLDESISILSRTPAVLEAELRGLPDAWTRVTEGPGTWSPYAVIGHLIHGEDGDWMTRVRRILEHGESRPFESFDREAQFRGDQSRPLDDLLSTFANLRKRNLAVLAELDLQESQMTLTGLHPTLGVVTLRQLLATWTAHDMAHILQINRTMARRYRQDVGPWAQFLSVMR